MELLEMLQNRRSVRAYTDQAIPREMLEQVLAAGLLSPSGRKVRPWELIVVTDRAVLDKMVGCRDGSARMLAGAQAAVVVVADQEKTDVWVEDCAIVMSNMHLMADSLGLGSCWVQGRLRQAANGQSTEGYLRDLLGFPDTYRLEATLALGQPASHPPRQELDDLPREKIHWGRF